MKNLFKKNRIVVLYAFALITLFSYCNKKRGPEGYTGEVTNPAAKKLVTKCHFIPADSINIWVARYRKDSAEKKIIENLPAISMMLNNSCSFNSCIIRNIINNKDCIGLRVLYGMSADHHIHVILIGIQPDYSDLYIHSPEDCCGGKSLLENAGASPSGLTSNGPSGGAEYGQMP